jgi:hypothetical protein
MRSHKSLGKSSFTTASRLALPEVMALSASGAVGVASGWAEAAAKGLDSGKLAQPVSRAKPRLKAVNRYLI